MWKSPDLEDTLLGLIRKGSMRQQRSITRVVRKEIVKSKQARESIKESWLD